MKILMVAIPNHHFFQWVNQLKDSGHEVYWFDITDGGPEVERISWVYQIKGWKLRFDFPFRQTIKNKFPVFYSYVQKYNEKNVQDVFQKKLDEIKPDLVHCFEMKLAGIPILDILEKYPALRIIYSSWGSDLYYYKGLGLTKEQVERFLVRANYLITDCKRDHNIAVANGFKNCFLGVFPGNGGISIDKENIRELENRNILLIKGYEDGVGKAINILEAIELVPLNLIQKLEIIIYSADAVVEKHIQESSFLSSLNIKILNRYKFVSNPELLKLMGKSVVHIANSISDGMPNVLLEAMGMGAFPIQSNPGNVAEEVIKHGFNGYLIDDPHKVGAIAKIIENAINDSELRKSAKEHNINFIAKNYNRSFLQKEILHLYNEIFLNKTYNK